MSVWAVLIASALACAGCALVAGLNRHRARLEQSPEPQIPRYTYTTERTYDEKKAVAAARLARTRTPTGRKLKVRRQVDAAVDTKVRPFKKLERR